jgi:hypothetical protein
MSKYEALRDHLQACGKSVLTISFSKIEEVVGPLPKSASTHRAWWANEEVGSHVQARSWMDAGYRCEPDIAHRTVTFRRGQA